MTRPIRTVLDHSATPEDLKAAIDRLTRLLDAEFSDLERAATTFRTKLIELGDVHSSVLDEQRRDAADELTALAPKPAGHTDQQLKGRAACAAVAWPRERTTISLAPSSSTRRDACSPGWVRPAAHRDCPHQARPGVATRADVEAALGDVIRPDRCVPWERRVLSRRRAQADQWVLPALDPHSPMFSLAFLVAFAGGIDSISVG